MNFEPNDLHLKLKLSLEVQLTLLLFDFTPVQFFIYRRDAKHCMDFQINMSMLEINNGAMTTILAFQRK